MGKPFGEGPDSKYFRLCGLQGLGHSNFTLLSQHKSSHGQCVNTGALLCANKTLYTTPDTGQIWPVGQSFPSGCRTLVIRLFAPLSPKIIVKNHVPSHTFLS